MNKIFAGMLLIFLNFHIDAGTVRVGLIPTFLGYLIMHAGLSEIERFSSKFSGAKPLVLVMLVYSTILYIMDLHGLWASDIQPAIIVLSLISMAMSLYISFSIVMGIVNIEKSGQIDINATQLYGAWQLLALFHVIGYVVFFTPLAGIILIVIGFIVGLYYLAVFNRTRGLFYTNYLAISSNPPDEVVMHNSNYKPVIYISLVIIVAVAGLLVMRGHNFAEYRTISPSGEIRVFFNPNAQTLEIRHRHRRGSRHFYSGVNNPEFIWSPCGEKLAVNMYNTPHRNRQSSIITAHPGNHLTSVVTPSRWFIEDRHEETRVDVDLFEFEFFGLGNFFHERVEAIEWIDNETLRYRFSWPTGIIGQYMMGQFVWHYPTWTITQLEHHLSYH